MKKILIPVVCTFLLSACGNEPAKKVSPDNNLDKCTLRFSWWGGDDRHQAKWLFDGCHACRMAVSCTVCTDVLPDGKYCSVSFCLSPPMDIAHQYCNILLISLADHRRCQKVQSVITLGSFNSFLLFCHTKSGVRELIPLTGIIYDNCLLSDE